MESFWTGLYAACAGAVACLPKLCDALFVDPHTAGAKRERMLSSAAVACQLIKAVERALLHAVAERDPGAAAAVVGCVWAPPEQQQAAQLLGASDSCGLLACLDQLAAAGRGADLFASLQVQVQIARTLCRVVRTDQSADGGPSPLLHALVDCGAVRSLCLHLRCVADALRAPARDRALIPPLARDLKALLAAATLVWKTLLGADDAKVDAPRPYLAPI